MGNEMMRPIKSELKSRRIKWDKETNAINWTYIKQLRENNPTKRIYEENPYVEVFQFRDNMYALFSENADGHKDQWCFMVLGSEKALLIDTAFGIGNYRALAQRIAGDREVIVANTHATYDHSYGNVWFEKVHCHKYSAPVMRVQMDPHVWDYLFDENGNNIWLDFDKADLPPFREYEIVECEDHTVFDLGGGVEVEMIWMPGHQGGHCFYLDKSNRILFTGDAIEMDQSNLAVISKEADVYEAPFANVENMYHQLKQMMEDYYEEIDYLFPAHGVLEIESRVLPGFLKGLEEIMADPEHPTRKDEAISKKGKKKIIYLKQVPGFTEIIYDPKRVYVPKD